jgi:hypothetical protein
VPGVVEVVLIHVRNAILKITKPEGWDKKAREAKEAEEDLKPLPPKEKEPTEMSDLMLVGKKKKKKKRLKKTVGDAASGEGIRLPDIGKGVRTKTKTMKEFD